MTFTWMDWAFVIAVVFFLIYGAIKGFANQLFGFISVVAAFVGSAFLMQFVKPYLQDVIQDDIVNSVVSYFIVLLVLLVVISVLRKIFDKIAKKDKVKKADKFLGMLFGLCVAYVIFSVFCGLCSISVENETVSQLLTKLSEAFANSTVVNVVYGNFNPFWTYVVYPIIMPKI